MRVLGIDPSSIITGTTVLDSELVVNIDHWNGDKTKSHPENMKRLFYYIAEKIHTYKPQMAAIEMAAFRQGGKAGDGGRGNVQVIQIVSFYQATCALACKLNGLMVIETRASSARKAALGNGGLSKDAVWELMKKNYPETFKLFSAKTRGGLDEMDSLVLALAGPSVAEQ